MSMVPNLISWAALHSGGGMRERDRLTRLARNDEPQAVDNRLHYSHSAAA